MEVNGFLAKERKEIGRVNIEDTDWGLNVGALQNYPPGELFPRSMTSSSPKSLSVSI